MFRNSVRMKKAALACLVTAVIWIGVSLVPFATLGWIRWGLPWGMMNKPLSDYAEVRWGIGPYTYGVITTVSVSNGLVYGVIAGSLTYALSRTRYAWPRCRRCGYNLHGLVKPRCPECGESFKKYDWPQCEQCGYFVRSVSGSRCPQCEKSFERPVQ